MTTGDKRLMPTTTVHSVRLKLFQPTHRPTVMKGEIINTQWGKIKVWARLGQQHADLLEAICFCREKRKDLEDGSIKLLVDPARVRVHAGITSGSQVDNAIRDLQQAIIEIIEPRHLACQGQVIGHIDKAMRADGTPITRANPLGGERTLWSVTLGPVLSRLVMADIWLGYDPAPIARLDHHISQAVARHVLTHKGAPSGGWKLDTLIRAVAGEIGEQALRDRRREVRRDAEALAALGIVIDGDRVAMNTQKQA